MKSERQTFFDEQNCTLDSLLHTNAGKRVCNILLLTYLITIGVRFQMQGSSKSQVRILSKSIMCVMNATVNKKGKCNETKRYIIVRINKLCVQRLYSRCFK